MNMITIPKNLIKNDDLVIIPRKEYEEFLQLQNTIKTYKIFKPTLAQLKDLKIAREDYKQGKYITINELKQKLAIKN